MRRCSSRGVAVLTLPGDVGGLDAASDAPARAVRRRRPAPAPDDPARCADAAELLDDAARVTLLVGAGAREARADVLALADRLAAPMVLTLKAKEGLEHDNPFQVGQTGLIGNPAARARARGRRRSCSCSAPTSPTATGTRRARPSSRSTSAASTSAAGPRSTSGVVGDAGAALRGAARRARGEGRTARTSTRRRTLRRTGAPASTSSPTRPTTRSGIVKRVRAALDNPEQRIRPEALAAAVDRHAAADAIFTSDTGMSTVWLSRFVTMRGTRRLRRLLQPRLDGQRDAAGARRASARPRPPGRRVLRRRRPDDAPRRPHHRGDLPTCRSRLVVFDNGRLGMVKLEQEQGGLPEFGTDLDNPDLAAVARAIGLQAVRIEDPEEVDAAIRDAFALDGPVLIDAITNPDEVSLPPKVGPHEAWGFAIAKMTEALESRGA